MPEEVEAFLVYYLKNAEEFLLVVVVEEVYNKVDKQLYIQLYMAYLTEV